MTGGPDMTPMRMSATDVASLAPVEVYAILVHLAGDPDPVVTQALIGATRRTLARTRVDDKPAFLMGLDQ